MNETPTCERLARTLEELGDPRLAEMIQHARAGYYDDFKTTIEFPQIQLVKDLNALGLYGLAQRARAGEWEATEQEAIEWMISLEGKAATEQFFARFPPESESD